MPEAKKEIRPAIHLSNADSEIENFQNRTLRPILKMQNDLYLKIFHTYSARHDANFSVLSKAKKESFIDSALQKDLSFKNFLLGISVGMFTVQEADFYLSDSKNINKRIISMLITRLKSQL